MKKLTFLLLMLPGIGYSQTIDYTPNVQQRIIKSSSTVYSVDVASHTSTQMDSTKLTGSFIVTVQNLDSSPICCALDTIASTSTVTGNSCQEVSAKGTVGDKVDFFRWWQNLSVYCRTTKSGATSNARVLQGK